MRLTKPASGTLAFASVTLALGLLGALSDTTAAVAQGTTSATASSINYTAIGFFLFFVLVTLCITYWAARHSHSASEYYSAGGQITAAQNGLALAGDLISAGAFLGLSGLIFATGFDGLVYAVGYTLGYPMIIFFMADRLRRLGKYTFSDVVAFRLSERPVRVLAAFSSLSIVAFYLIAQLVGAGQLIQLLFGLPYTYAVVIVGVLMICYVMFGGMVATTWVQIVKAALLLATGTFTAVLVFAAFGFSYERIIAKAVEVHAKHAAILQPQTFAASPWSTISLGYRLVFRCGGPAASSDARVHRAGRQDGARLGILGLHDGSLFLLADLHHRIWRARACWRVAGISAAERLTARRR